MKAKIMETTGAGLIELDPRSKLFLLLLGNLLVVLSVPLIYEYLIIAFIGSLFCVTGYSKKGLWLMGAYFSVLLINNVVLVYIIKFQWATFLLGGGMLMRKLFPCIMLGNFLISTTKVSDFILAMEKMRVPRQLIIPFSVMLRFFPTVYKELGYITDAMKLRGIEATFKNWVLKPIMMIEYIFVPLLMSAVKIGEELSAAALTRGLSVEEKRSSYSTLTYGKIDYGVTVFVLVLMIGIIKYQI